MLSWIMSDHDTIKKNYLNGFKTSFNASYNLLHFDVSTRLFLNSEGYNRKHFDPFSMINEATRHHIY